MKIILLPVGAVLALIGNLSGVPPAQAAAPRAIAAPMPSLPISLLPAVPSRLTATGLAQPIGPQIALAWSADLRARSYKVYRDGQFLTSSDRAFWTDYDVAAGETHAYTVAAVALTGESRQSASVSATVPAGGGQVIFADALQNGWQSWGWAGLDFASTSAVRAGRSVRVAAGPWQALYLHHAPFSTSSYGAVTFWIHGGSQGGQRLCVKALRNGVPQTPVSLSPLPAGQWQPVTISLRDLGVANVADMDGLWVQDASGTTQAPFALDEIALTAAPPAPPVVAAPVGLSATPQWKASCPKCGGMAMAHIVLAWNAVPNAASYAVYRNGTKVQDGLLTPNWIDMDVVSGQTYAYTVTAVGPGGESVRSASATATAPSPPPASALGVPFDVTVSAAWTGALTKYGGAVSNMLAWPSVAGAATYNVYQSDVLVAHGLTTPAFTLTPAFIHSNALYTVTAVDSQGMESLPSAPLGYINAYTSETVSSFNNYIPPTPDMLTATPEWNLGAPRVVVRWHACGENLFNVFRDGVKLTGGIWQTYYIDADVRPGSTHVYTVSAQNTDWLPSIEGLSSAPVPVTALSASPSPIPGKVRITKVIANDDSAVVFFTPVPGAVDYRLYAAGDLSKVKYAGEITTQCTEAGMVPRTPIAIEWNGINPSTGADLVVEAVDKFGPFQKMDGDAGDGMMNMGGMMAQAINGQGDPSNVPNVLAQSDSFHVSCSPVSLTGSQAFFDNFRSSTPFVKQPIPAPMDGAQYYGSPGDYAVYANDKWEVRQYGADLVNSKIFTMGSHFMDTTYDGGGLGSSNPAHNNVASMVMMPKATADLSGGKVLHVTFEVDAHMDSRRWCELMIGEVGDPLIDCAKFSEFGLKPTPSGKLFRWQIEDEMHYLQTFLGDGNFAGVDLIQPTDFADGQSVGRLMWDHTGPYANGTMQDLDKRHRFDLYLSKTHYRIQETTPDGLYNVVREKDFPAGVSLPFDKCQIYFVHQVYHTSNDRVELIKYYPYNSYWPNFRPYADERHWDNMGFEVLPSFPASVKP